MDWINLLRSLQHDFIKRLTSGCVLHCQTEGQYSELTIISSERLKRLRAFCWQMAEKYKRVLPVREVFISYLKGKLGEEVIKERLAELITEVDYQKKFGGDGKTDFTLTCNPAIGIEVKSRQGSIDKVRWSISSEEVEKNAVVVCILIQEEVNEAQSEYHLFLAGFLPTRMIKLKTGRISFGIEQLLYGGGLWYYLEQCLSSKYNYSQQTAITNQYYAQGKSEFKLKINQLIENSLDLGLTDTESDVDYALKGEKCFSRQQYEAAIINYSQAIKLNYQENDIYYKRGLAYYQIGDYEAAIADYSQAIRLNPYDAKAFNNRGLTHYQLGNYSEAIEDYTQAIMINPHIAVVYKNRAEARSHLADNQGAIEDYTQAIKINPAYANTDKDSGIARYLLTDIRTSNQANRINPYDANNYKNRGLSRCELGDFEGAIEDYTQAIQINPNYADVYYMRGNAHYELGDFATAIEDYTQAIKINYNYADAYYNRGQVHIELEQTQQAIEDFEKAADIYRKQGQLEALKDTQQRILNLKIEESLDVLNF